MALLHTEKIMDQVWLLSWVVRGGLFSFSSHLDLFTDIKPVSAQLFTWFNCVTELQMLVPSSSTLLISPSIFNSQIV